MLTGPVKASKVASMVRLPPVLTVMVRCQGLRFSFSIETLISGTNWIVDGVLPMYFPST